MVKIDFTIFNKFSSCPLWWRNLVNSKINLFMSLEERNIILRRELDRFYAKIIDNEDDPEDIDYLIFETEDDFNAFKLLWTIYGEQTSISHEKVS